MTRPALFQSNSASGTISRVGWRMDGFGSEEETIDELCEVDGFMGSMGLKLRLAAKRGMLDEADDDESDVH